MSINYEELSSEEKASLSEAGTLVYSIFERESPMKVTPEKFAARWAKDYCANNSDLNELEDKLKTLRRKASGKDASLGFSSNVR